MKIILGSRIHRYLKRLGIFLITVAIVVGIAGCESTCAPLQYVLRVLSTLGGTATIVGEGTSPYPSGTVVTLVAVADECYEFVNWTGDSVADPNATTTTVTIDEAKNVTANFALLNYDLTVDSTGGGQVTSPGEDTFTYDCGTVVALVAVAEEGYYFVNWSGDVDTIANTNAPTTTITLKGDYSITANFELIPPGQFVLTTSSTAGGSVPTPGEGTFPYDEETVVDLVAEAEECYEFVNWTGDPVANPDSATTTITMDEAKNVTANFALLSYNLAADSTDGGQVTTPGEGTFPYACGTVVDLVAEAEEGYSFVEWSGNVDTIADIDAAETTITMNGHYSITANFGLFAGGNGTAVDPYQIADWWHLDNVRNYLSSHFIVINDLDLNSIGYTELASDTSNEGKGWQPIGTIAVNDAFVGSFDGQGYEICDLFINRPDESDVGLFGVVEELGVIENVGVVNTDNVTGQDNVGGLVGKNEGTVSNSYSTGNVTGNLNIGGLVGWNFKGTVTDTYSTGSVTGNTSVGGLVGWNTGTMSNSYSTGGVTGNTSVGGLTGKNAGSASNSYSTGSVTGDDNIGGLVGKNDKTGTVSNSYATGSVTGDDNIGGLVGKNDKTGTVSNSYSTGSVTGNTHVGGLMGRNQGTESNSFWDTQTSGRGSSDGGTGKPTEEMMDIATFTDTETEGLDEPWDITDVDPGETNPAYTWNIVDDETYPFQSWESAV